MWHAIPQTHSPFYPHRLIVWIRQSIKAITKWNERNVQWIWMRKKCTFYVQIQFLKSALNPDELRFTNGRRYINMTIWKQPALASYREVPMKTEPESKLTKKFYKIGHFRVPKTLTFKMRLGAQPFLWKWVLFAWEWKMIFISKAEHLPSFWNRHPEELGTGLFADVFSEVMLWSRDHVLS